MLTALERQQIVNEVIEALKSESHSLSPTSLEVVTSLTGVNSLPALRGTDLVLVPIGLLSASAEAAASTAITAAGNANNAAQQASAAAQQLANYVASGGYDAPNNRFVFFNGNNTPLFYIDMSPFTKDGHIENASFANGALTLTYNADANKAPLVVSLAEIFDASQYYTARQVESLIVDATDFEYDAEDEALIFNSEITAEPTTTEEPSL